MKELRNIKGNVEIRMEGEETFPTIYGYAAVFNSPTDMGWYIEQIDSRAFDNCDMSDVIAVFNHDEEKLLSRTTGQPNDLQLMTDTIGLKYEFKGKNECSQEVAQNIKLNFITGSSFMFTTEAEEWTYDMIQPDGSKKDMRTITKIKKLWDVGPVVHPAYQDAQAMARSQSELRSKAESMRPKKQPTLAELRLKINKSK